MKGLFAGIVCATALVTSTTSTGQSRPAPEQLAQQYRVALMRVIQANMGPMSLMAHGRTPYDPALIKRNSERVAFLAGMVAEAFELDTSQATNVKTAALPAIWKNKADFDQLLQHLTSSAEMLSSTAKGDDQAATKAAINATVSTCGDCHQRFRESPAE
jgi:cytochrome c556